MTPTREAARAVVRLALEQLRLRALLPISLAALLRRCPQAPSVTCLADRALADRLPRTTATTPNGEAPAAEQTTGPADSLVAPAAIRFTAAVEVVPAKALTPATTVKVELVMEEHLVVMEPERRAEPMARPERLARLEMLTPRRVEVAVVEAEVVPARRTQEEPVALVGLVVAAAAVAVAELRPEVLAVLAVLAS